MGTMIKFLPCLCLAVILTACSTVPDEYGLGDPVKPMTEREKMTASARNAALESRYDFLKVGELSAAEKAYRNNPKDVLAATHYASLLRRVNMAGQAQMILKPFAANPVTADEIVLIEYAKILLQNGDLDGAQRVAQEAFLQNGSPASQMVLGVAVDAQGHHQAAENHLRQALEKATVDSKLRAAIKNNLALCLLSQNKVAEAESLLSSINGSDLTDNALTVDANAALASDL